MRKKDDILLKGVFEDFFPEMLQFFYPDSQNIFDVNTGFEFLNKELLEIFPERTKAGGSRFVDLLVKCYLVDGREEWILVHTEIQGTYDKDFAARMFEYYYRVYDRYKVDILALAIFTYSSKEPKQNLFQKSFLDTSISYHFKAYNILEHTEDQLIKMNNPFALVVLAAQKALLEGKIPEEELSQQRLTIIKILIEKMNLDHKRISRFISFLKNYIFINNKRINRNFDKEVEVITKNHKTMGVFEAIELINRLEKEEVLSDVIKKLLIADKFTIEEIMEYTGASKELVLKVKKDIS